MVRKPTLPYHCGTIVNPKSFTQAFICIQKNPTKNYYTTGNKTPFVAEARLCMKGIHKGEKVIIFKTKTAKNYSTPKAYAYDCCWGHKTNCYKTYIDCFTKAL